MQTTFAYFTFLLCWHTPSIETFVQIYILPHNKEWIYISNYAATAWSEESWLKIWASRAHWRTLNEPYIIQLKPDFTDIAQEILSVYIGTT